MAIVKFSIPGQPVAKGRHRTVVWKQCIKCGKKTMRDACRCGGFVKALFATNYPDKDTENYEALVKLAASQARGGELPFSAPCVLRARFRFAIPPSRVKKLKPGDRHGQRPDLDNLIKSIKDGMNKVIYNDDALIWKVEAEKVWAEDCGVDIEVECE